MHRIQLGTRTVLLDAHAVESPAGREPLTPLEVDLLRHLSASENPVSRDTLLVEVWGYSAAVQSRAVHHTVTRLRRKLEDNPSKPRFLKTVRGLGYSLDIPGPEPPRRPDLPTLFGRGHDLMGLCEQTRQPGVVTVLGPGGVGKTHLLRHVLSHVGEPSLFCDVSLSHSAEDIAAELCRALGMMATTRLDTVARAIIGQGVAVLALDNLEQVIQGARRVVTALVESAPHLCIITTSRVSLNLEAERTWVLPPLPLPTELHVSKALNNPALALFVDRVQRVNPSFVVTQDSLDDVLSVLAAVDGLPLALELAAPRTRVLPMAALARRLQHDIQLLRRRSGHGEARHQTLSGVLQSSMDALEPNHKRLFAQMSCFSGSFSLDAVEAIADRPQHAVDAAETLIENSLVVSRAGRLRLLVPIRAFASQRLGAQPDLYERTVTRHRLLYAQRGLPNALRQAECDGQANKRLVADRHNLVTACEHSVRANDADAAIRAALAATQGLSARAEWPACHRLSETLLELTDLTDAQALEIELLVARSLNETGRREQALGRLQQTKPCGVPHLDAMRGSLLGEFHHVAGNRDTGLAALAGAQRCTNGGANDWTHALILGTYARVLGENGRHEDASARYTECLTLLAAQGRHGRLAPVAANFANHHREVGNREQALRYYDLAIRSAVQSGSQRVEAVTRCNRAAFQADFGHHDAAQAGFTRGLDQLRRIGDIHFEGILSGMLSELCVDMNRLDEADDALDRAYACHHALNDALWMNVVQARRAVVQRVRGDTAAAIATLETIVPLLKEPLLQGYAQFYSQLAQARAQAGQLERAVADFAHAQHALEHGQWLNELALCLAAEAMLLRAERPDRAKAAVAHAERLRQQIKRPAESRLGRAIARAQEHLKAPR